MSHGSGRTDNCGRTQQRHRARDPPPRAVRSAAAPGMGHRLPAGGQPWPCACCAPVPGRRSCDAGTAHRGGGRQDRSPRLLVDEPERFPRTLPRSQCRGGDRLRIPLLSLQPEARCRRRCWHIVARVVARVEPFELLGGPPSRVVRLAKGLPSWALSVRSVPLCTIGGSTAAKEQCRRRWRRSAAPPGHPGSPRSRLSIHLAKRVLQSRRTDTRPSVGAPVVAARHEKRSSTACGGGPGRPSCTAARDGSVRGCWYWLGRLRRRSEGAIRANSADTGSRGEQLTGHYEVAKGGGHATRRCDPPRLPWRAAQPGDEPAAGRRASWT